jgi:hypothetical protein
MSILPVALAMAAILVSGYTAIVFRYGAKITAAIADTPEWAAKVGCFVCAGIMAGILWKLFTN